MTTNEAGPTRPGSSLRAGQIAGWQAALVGIAGLFAWSLGRGSFVGVALGAILLHASMRATAAALHWSIGGAGRPAWAMGIFLVKLALLIGVAVAGLSTSWIAPMSFAVGATTLPLAIVLDTCYSAWANPRAARSAESPAETETPRTTKPWNIR